MKPTILIFSKGGEKMSKLTDYPVVFGHLDKNSEVKIGSTTVSNGQVIFSEKSGLQFIDYADKRHTYGSVLSGVYNNTGYIDFATSTLADSLVAIKTNGLVVDGQIIKVDNSIYKYRKIGDNNLIIKIDESNVDVEQSKVGFIVYLPDFTQGDLVSIDFLVSLSNETYTNKIFLVKVVNNVIDLTACQDLDGTFDSNTFDLNVAHNGSGLFTISATVASTLKVVSYSVSSSGSTKNEGLYVAASDL